MSLKNPTPLKLGMSGTLDGRRYTVRGRVVLSVEIEGEDYFWNEFNLVNEAGESLTLVFEEEESGPAWKLFEYFEPQRPMPAQEAREKKVGDTFEIDGRTARVALVDESRVRHIEGQAPEGVEVGDVAHFFNAELGNADIVVSWTGDEVEYYRGRRTSADGIAAVFGFNRGSAGRPSPARAAESANSSSRFVLWAVGIMAALLTAIGAYSCARDRSRPLPPPKQSAAAQQLRLGGEGELGARRYRVVGHALVEIAQVGRRFDRHEYALISGEGDRWLLINAPTGNPKEWHLLSATPPPAALTPFAAAALRDRGPVEIGGVKWPVARAFMARVLSSEGATGEEWPATLHYGLVAAAGEERSVTRWDERAVQTFRGRAVAESDVLSAFRAAPKQ